MKRGLALAAVAVVLSAAVASAQPPVSTLVEALRPALPYPDSDEAGMQPAGGGETHKWFVVWPAPGEDPRVIVRANPLHPDTQKAVAQAEAVIQRAVAAAERRAQAAYDRALEQLRKTGKGSGIDGITLDDEGVAGQRIDAELELTIALMPLATLEVASGAQPGIGPGTGGAAWLIRIPANEYQVGDASSRRAMFHPAEAYVVFGAAARPETSSVEGKAAFTISWPGGAQGFAVVLRGNEGLLDQVLATANWARLTQP